MTIQYRVECFHHTNIYMIFQLIDLLIAFNGDRTRTNPEEV